MPDPTQQLKFGYRGSDSGVRFQDVVVHGLHEGEAWIVQDIVTGFRFGESEQGALRLFVSNVAPGDRYTVFQAPGATGRGTACSADDAFGISGQGGGELGGYPYDSPNVSFAPHGTMEGSDPLGWFRSPEKYAMPPSDLGSLASWASPGDEPGSVHVADILLSVPGALVALRRLRSIATKAVHDSGIDGHWMRLERRSLTESGTDDEAVLVLGVPLDDADAAPLWREVDESFVEYLDGLDADQAESINLKLAFEVRSTSGDLGDGLSRAVPATSRF